MSRNVRLRYEKETDKYLIEALDPEYGWSLIRSQKCQKAVCQKEDEEPEYVHFTLLKELARLADLGYDIHIAEDC